MDSDDRILDVIGLLVVLGVLAGIGILVFFGGNTGPANPQPEAPDANWSAARLNATHVQVGHVGGESVDAADLVVTVGGEERPVTWNGTVDRGQTGVVRGANGTEVTLYWTGDPRADRMELDSWTP